MFYWQPPISCYYYFLLSRKSQSLFYDKSLLRYILLFNFQEIGNGSGIVKKTAYFEQTKGNVCTWTTFDVCFEEERKASTMVLIVKQRGNTHFFFSIPIVVQWQATSQPLVRSAPFPPCVPSAFSSMPQFHPIVGALWTVEGRDTNTDTLIRTHSTARWRLLQSDRFWSVPYSFGSSGGVGISCSNRRSGVSSSKSSSTLWKTLTSPLIACNAFKLPQCPEHTSCQLADPTSPQSHA